MASSGVLDVGSSAAERKFREVAEPARLTRPDSVPVGNTHVASSAGGEPSIRCVATTSIDGPRGANVRSTSETLLVLIFATVQYRPKCFTRSLQWARQFHSRSSHWPWIQMPYVGQLFDRRVSRASRSFCAAHRWARMTPFVALTAGGFRPSRPLGERHVDRCLLLRADIGLRMAGNWNWDERAFRNQMKSS